MPRSNASTDRAWRECLHELDRLVLDDVKRMPSSIEIDRASTVWKKSKKSKKVKPVKAAEEDLVERSESESESDADESESDRARGLYLRYVEISNELNECDVSCVHAQKRELICEALKATMARATMLRTRHSEAFDTASVEETLRHRNELCEQGYVLVPERFKAARRKFLEGKMVIVKTCAGASVGLLANEDDDDEDASSVVAEAEEVKEDGDLISDNSANSGRGKDDDDCNNESMEKSASSISMIEEENDETKDATTTTTTKEEGEVKEAEEERFQKYTGEHEIAIVRIQRFMRGTLCRNNMRVKVDEELERLGMLRRPGSKNTTRRQEHLGGRVDSLSYNSKSEEVINDVLLTEKIERLREERVKELEKNAPRVYEHTKTAFLNANKEKSLDAFHKFVCEYRESHGGEFPSKDDNFEAALQLPIKKSNDSDDDDNDFDDGNDDVSSKEDEKNGFSALRKILMKSERLFPRRLESEKEARNTRFSERAEKKLLERDALREVSNEITEFAKTSLEEMIKKEKELFVVAASASNVGEKSDKAAAAAAAAAAKKSSKKREEETTTTKTTMKKTTTTTATTTKKSSTNKDGKKKAKKSNGASSSASTSDQKAFYASLDEYAIASHLLEHNVSIECCCEYDYNSKFIASASDEFIYAPSGDSITSETNGPDSVLDDQKRVIESIKLNVSIPLGATTCSEWLKSYPIKPKNLVLIGPDGCGKRHFAKNVIARETGSIFFDISPKNITMMSQFSNDNDNNNDDDEGNTINNKEEQNQEEIAFCTDLLKRTFQLAKKWAPSVIFIGDMNRVLETGKAKKGGTNKRKTTTDKKKKKKKNDDDDDCNEDDEEKESSEGGGAHIVEETTTIIDSKSKSKTIDPKSFKTALISALKTLEKENNNVSGENAYRVCVCATISDVSRLTKKDEKQIFTKVFTKKETFVGPFFRPSRAARRDLLETFFHEAVNSCNDDYAKKKKSAFVGAYAAKEVMIGARDEGAISELSHFSENANRAILKAATTIAIRRTCKFTSKKSPAMFTDADRAICWRFASAFLQRVKEERVAEKDDEDEVEEVEVEVDFEEAFGKSDASLRAFARRFVSS